MIYVINDDMPSKMVYTDSTNILKELGASNITVYLDYPPNYMV
jgi:hypothetical protein